MALELYPLRFELQFAQSLTLGTLTNSQSFIFGDSNWKFCKVGYPVGTPKPDIQIQTVLTWDFFKAFIFYEKNQSLLDYKNYVFANWKKYKVS